MRRPLVPSLLAILGVALSACTDARSPTDSGGRPVPVDLVPSYQLDPDLFSYDPIDRIRMVAIEVGTSSVVGNYDSAVDPSVGEWVLALAIDLGEASSLDVIVEIELFSGPSVEWSGRAGPFTVSAASSAQAVDVYRGPMDNLDVASVAVDDPPSQMVVGTTTTVSGSVTLMAGSSAAPILFWASADPTVVSVTEEGLTTTIRALAPGTTEIIAAAGAAYFEFSLDAVATMASVVVSPPSPSLSGPDQSVQFTATVTDGFGNPVPDPQVVWRSTNTAVATIDQSGLATSLGAGTTQIEATSSGVTGSATLTVGSGPPPAVDRTWLGGSTAWSDPNNWSPTGVPGTNDNVSIPSTQLQPAMSADEAIGSLTVGTSVFVDQGGFTLTVARDVLVSGGSILTSGVTDLSTVDATSYPVVGTFDHLRISSPRTLTGGVITAGDLDVRSELSVGPNTITVNGNLMVQTAAGAVVMTEDQQGSSGIGVVGDATFSGASSVGNLTGGVIQVLGDFTVTSANSPTSFQSEGTFVYLTPQGDIQTVSFDNPGPAGQSLADVYVFQGQNSVTRFVSDALVTGTLFGGNLELEGNGSSTLEVSGRMDLDVVTIDNLPLRLVSDEAPDQHNFENATFINMPTNVDHLHVEIPGAGANFPLNLSSPEFVTAPGNGFFHLRGVNKVPAGQRLHIELLSPLPSPPPPAAYTAGTNVEIVWP